MCEWNPKCEKLKVDEKTLTLCKDLDALKDLMNTREKVFDTDLSSLESEFLDLKLRLESLVSENNQLREKAHKAESDLAQNRHWNDSSKALNWLNTHHSWNKKGLGFANRRVIKPVNKKYVGLQENIIYFRCEKTGHYRMLVLWEKGPWRETHCILSKYGLEKMS